MNEEEEAAARNIKLVRYTHPGAQNWKSNDGLERSRSLPVQQKKKSDGRLMDMLKSRSTKFHNLTVNRRSPSVSKDARSSVAKKQDACFLPVRTPNSVAKPAPIPPKTIQRLNLDTNLIPGNNSSNNVSFTSKVKKMLEEQRPELATLHKKLQPEQQQEPLEQYTQLRSIDNTDKNCNISVQHESTKPEAQKLLQKSGSNIPTNNIDDASKKGDETELTRSSPQVTSQPQIDSSYKSMEQSKRRSQNDLQRIVSDNIDAKSHLEIQTSQNSGKENQREKNGRMLLQSRFDKNTKHTQSKSFVNRVSPDRNQSERIPAQRQAHVEGETDGESPDLSETRSNGRRTSISKESSFPFVESTPSEQDLTRSDVSRLFAQVEAANHDTGDKSRFEIIEALKERIGGKVDSEGAEHSDISDPINNDNSLQGCVVAFEGELGPSEDSGTSKLRLVYVSDDEEEKRPKHRVLPPSSGVLRPASPRRLIPHMKDPTAEKRKNDREVALEAIAKLSEKKAFSKETFFQIIDKGVANHRALEGNPTVSVTNDVCSVNNYETSHAYYYQQFDRRSKLAWLSLHDSKSSLGREPFKDIWRCELQAELMASTVSLHSIRPSNLSVDQQNSLDYQIGQLKKLLQNKFLVKLSGSLDKKVDILILYGQNEKVLNELLQKRQNSSFRVWSLQRALDYLQDIGIDLQEWSIDKNAQDREPILDVPISEDSIQEEIEDSTEELKETEEEVEGVVDKEIGQEAQNIPHVERNTLRKVEELQLRNEGTKHEKNRPELERKGLLPANELNLEKVGTKVGKPNSKSEKEPRKSRKTVTKPPKKVVKKSSSFNEGLYVQELLQKASDAMDKRDQQLKAAHNIILALSRDVMRQEIQITSLSGQLKHSERDLQNQFDLAQQFKICMAEQEIEMAHLRSKLAKRNSKKTHRKNQVLNSP